MENRENRKKIHHVLGSLIFFASICLEKKWVLIIFGGDRKFIFVFGAKLMYEIQKARV